MHDSQLNPSQNPALAGKARRHFSGQTKAIRHFCADANTERAIVTLREWLKGKIAAGDVVSISLLARRAIAVYLSHVAAMNAEAVAREREEVRKGSRMPNPNARKRACKKK